jgi:hypothetical protein
MIYAGVPLVLALVFWAILTLVVAGSLVLAVLAARTEGRWLMVASGVLLLVAVIMVAVPHPGAPAVIEAVIALAAVAVSAFGGSPAVKTVLSLASPGREEEGDAGGILIAVPHEDRKREVLRGGLTIGVLERIATTASILAGVPEAIAVVIAIKGVGRFSELGASEAQERFIIGTFVSLGWAAVCGALAHLAW